MTSLSRFPPYIIAGAALFMITFYHVYNVRSKNSGLERNVKYLQEALSVSKEKNKVLVQDALQKIEKKDARIQLLEKENLSKHTKLGETQTELAKIKSNLNAKKAELAKLHQLAADHQDEISALTKSVSKSKQVLAQLSVKADHLMVDHKKLKKENTELEQQTEKLQNEIKQQKSERQGLDEQISTLKKEKEYLHIKVDDLTRKNEVIQESIKQKIKESYAARRVMTQRKQMKDTEDSKLAVNTVQNLVNKHVKVGQTDYEAPKHLVKSSEDHQVPEAVIGNYDKKLQNLSKVMVDSVDKSQSDVLKMMVNNSNTAKELKMVGNYSDSRNISRIMVYNDDTYDNTTRIKVENNVENREKRDFSSEQENNESENGEENFDRQTEDRNIKNVEVENGNVKRGSLGKEKYDEDFHKMRAGTNTLLMPHKTKDEVVEGDEESLSENKNENVEADVENGNFKRESLGEEKDDHLPEM